MKDRRDALSYHSERATQELDLGRTASTAASAHAHMQLASLHMQRMRELGDDEGPLPLSRLSR